MRSSGSLVGNVPLDRRPAFGSSQAPPTPRGKTPRMPKKTPRMSPRSSLNGPPTRKVLTDEEEKRRRLRSEAKEDGTLARSASGSQMEGVSEAKVVSGYPVVTPPKAAGTHTASGESGSVPSRTLGSSVSGSTTPTDGGEGIPFTLLSRLRNNPVLQVQDSRIMRLIGKRSVLKAQNGEIPTAVAYRSKGPLTRSGDSSEDVQDLSKEDVEPRPMVEAVASGPTPKLVPEDLRAKVTNLNSPRNHVDVSESKALDPPEDPQRIEETSVNQSSNSAIVWPGACEEGSAEPETISKEPLEEPPVPDVTEGVSAGGPLPAVPVERPEDGMTSTIPEEVPVKPPPVASGPAKGAGLDTSAEMPLLQNEAGSLVVPQTWRFVPPPPEQAPKPSYHDKVLVEEKTQDIASPLREASTPQAASKASEDLTPKKLIEELVQDQVKLDLRDKQQLVEQLVECLIDQVKRYEKELGAEQRANRALKMSLEVEQRKALMYHQRLSELAHLSFPEAADRLLEPEL